MVAVMRALLLRIAPDADGTPRYRMSLTNHHILLDGWSLPIVVQDLLSLYVSRDPASLPRVRPYRDYLAWLSARLPEARVFHLFQRFWRPDPAAARALAFSLLTCSNT